MADGELRDTRGVEVIELTAGEGERSGSQKDGSIAPAKESFPEQALIQALRQFIRNVPKEKEEETRPKKLGRLQLFTLILVSADAALIYSQMEHWLQNPLFQEILKILPWMLGVTAVGYANALRELLVEKAHHMKWAIMTAGLLAPLLLMQMRVFSVEIYADAATVKADDSRVVITQPTEGHFRIVFPSLDEYHISVDANSGNAIPFSVNLGRLRILRGTLVQIPLGGKIFGSREMDLSPLYSVSTHSIGDAEVNVEGEFQEGFVRDALQANSECPSVPPLKKSNQAMRCRVRGDGGFSLPSGKYTFTLLRSGCTRTLPPWRSAKQMRPSISRNFAPGKEDTPEVPCS